VGLPVPNAYRGDLNRILTAPNSPAGSSLKTCIKILIYKSNSNYKQPMMTYPNNIVPLLGPDISSTNSLGGIAPGKSKLGSWGAPQSEICDIFTPGALDAAPHFSLGLGPSGGSGFCVNFEATSFYSAASCQRGKRLLPVLVSSYSLVISKEGRGLINQLKFSLDN
jgi:hypothetical protein